jgi:hypothetical protein
VNKNITQKTQNQLKTKESECADLRARLVKVEGTQREALDDLEMKC